MAKMETKGIEELKKELLRLEDRAPQAAQKALERGGNVYATFRKGEIYRRKMKKSGDMINNVKVTIKPKRSVPTATIYSRGTDRKGVRNAEKEFYQHYGTKRIDATHWVDEAERRAYAPSLGAQAKAFFDEIGLEE